MQADKEFERAVRLLPQALRAVALSAPESLSQTAEELRLRVDRPLCIVSQGREYPLGDSRTVSSNELQIVLEIATRASAHSYADSIKRGFVTAEGGVRLGLAGEAITTGGVISGFRRISSLCIRIPRQKKGIADEVYEKLFGEGLGSTIILSPPGGGKTTLLRELVRLISGAGTRVCLVDERLEVSGVFEGKACFDLGTKTDVLALAPKAEGVVLALRALSPQLIAFDEITAPEDVEAAILAANCGVKLLTTAHAGYGDDLKKRPLYRRLLKSGVFDSFVVIENNDGVRQYATGKLP